MPVIWQLHCCLTSLFLCRRSALNSLHQGIFLLLDQHIAVPRVTSGGSRRRECPLPKNLPPYGHEPRDFWALPKSYGYFSGAPPSIPPCGFAVLVIPGKKADFAPTGAVCRSCTTLPVSIRAPPPGGKGVSPFPPGGGGSGRNRQGCTGAAHRSGRRKACFFARNDEYGEASRRNGGRGPRKVPAAFGLCPKVPRPVAEGRQLFGERALPAPAAAGGHARNLQMLTI